MVYQGKYLQNIREVFDVALKLAKNGTYAEQEAFFEAYANACARDNNISTEEGIRLAENNLGYFSGYCDNATVNLISKTYRHHLDYGK